jgi:hypothetical protein
MMPVQRHARRRLYCATCDQELGILRSTSSSRKFLYITGTLAVRQHADNARQWFLTCRNGHVTEWHGPGIDWRQDYPARAA